MRKPLVLVALLGAITVAFGKRRKAQQAERDLWTEASVEAPAPDLR